MATIKLICLNADLTHYNFLQLLGGDIQRKLAVKSCELRKAEFTIRRYKVATEKLLQFVEVKHKPENEYFIDTSHFFK